MLANLPCLGKVPGKALVAMMIPEAVRPQGRSPSSESDGEGAGDSEGALSITEVGEMKEDLE